MLPYLLASQLLHVTGLLEISGALLCLLPAAPETNQKSEARWNAWARSKLDVKGGGDHLCGPELHDCAS